MSPSIILASILLSASSPLVRPQPGTLVRVPSTGRPLITSDVNTVAHVWWDGIRIRDTRGNGWSMTGTVPQVAKLPPVPAGSGPYTTSAYYSLGSGPDVLDFTGDFTVCVVFVGSPTGSTWIVGDSNGSTNGWRGPVGNGCIARTWPGSVTVNGGATVAGEVNVCCVGRSGTTLYAKLNLSASAAQAGATVAVDAATPATIGWVAGAAMDRTIYEVWATTTTPSDALCTAVANEVKTKLAITAW